MGIRRKRIDEEFRGRALADLIDLDVAIDAETNTFVWADTLALADRFRLTVYDACYLKLAQRRGVPLATLDNDLRKAAEALEIPLLVV